jgi:hypothetical protein
MSNIGDQLQAMVQAAAATAFENAVDAVYEQITVLQPPSRSGELADSMYRDDTVADETSFLAQVGNIAPQALFTDQGTSPHEIDGNPLLVFDWPEGYNGPGTYAFRHVSHPGNEGTNWFSGPTQAFADQLQQEFDNL